MNHWHGNENSLFKHFQFLQNPHYVRKYKCHLHVNRSKLLIMIEEDHLHIIEKGLVQGKSLTIQHTSMFQTLLIKTRNFPFER